MRKHFQATSDSDMTVLQNRPMKCTRQGGRQNSANLGTGGAADSASPQPDSLHLFCLSRVVCFTTQEKSTALAYVNKTSGASTAAAHNIFCLGTVQKRTLCPPTIPPSTVVSITIHVLSDQVPSFIVLLSPSSVHHAPAPWTGRSSGGSSRCQWRHK